MAKKKKTVARSRKATGGMSLHIELNAKVEGVEWLKFVRWGVELVLLMLHYRPRE
jgi:hypothetical protein